MAVGTSDGEYYPSHLEHVLASLDTSGSTKEPLAPRNAPIDELRNGNEDPASRPAPTDIRSDVKVAQAGPNNKDTTPVPDNRPDLYEDENGLQRSRKNDSVLEQFNPFVDKMAKGLSQSDVDLIDKYHGFESTHGKWTDEDQKRIQPLLDAVDGQVKHLGNTESKFTPSGQEIIEFKNWDSLLFDKIMKHYKTINPGKRSEADLPENAKPTAAEFTPDSTWAAMVDSFTNPDSKVPSAEKMVQGNYSKVVDWLTENGKTPGQEMQNWSTKEKLGYMLSTAMGLVGPGKGTAVKPPSMDYAPAKSAAVSGEAGFTATQFPKEMFVANENIPGKGKADAAMSLVEKMTDGQFKDYLATRERDFVKNGGPPKEGAPTIGEVLEGFKNADKKTPYDRAVEAQQSDKFIQALRRNEKPELRLVNPELENAMSASRARREKFMSDSEARRAEFLKGGEPQWKEHSDIVHNLTDSQGRDIGSAVYRKHNDTWVGSRFNPENNQIIDRKTFRTQQEAKSYAEGNNNLNPSQEPQGRPVPSLEQRQTQEAQRAANDRNYAMGKGTERVNVGPGKGVLNDSRTDVLKMIESGSKPSDIAKRFDITPNAVRSWIRNNGKMNDLKSVLDKIKDNKDN